MKMKAAQRQTYYVTQEGPFLGYRSHLPEEGQKMKGAQFDKAFLQHERDDHAKLLKELQQQQDKIQDPDVKNFVSQTITAVQQHLDAAQGSKASSTPPSGQ